MMPNIPQVLDYHTNPNVRAVFHFHLKVVSQQTAVSQNTTASWPRWQLAFLDLQCLWYTTVHSYSDNQLCLVTSGESDLMANALQMSNSGTNISLCNKKVCATGK